MGVEKDFHEFDANVVTILIQKIKHRHNKQHQSSIENDH